MSSERHQILGMYLHLASASEKRQRHMVRDKLLVLAGSCAMEMELPLVPAGCRRKILSNNPGHLLKKYSNFQQALADSAFQTYQKHLERDFPLEKAEYMLQSLGIDQANARAAYYNDEEYAAALLGTTSEKLRETFGNEVPKIETPAEPPKPVRGSIAAIFGEILDDGGEVSSDSFDDKTNTAKQVEDQPAPPNSVEEAAIVDDEPVENDPGASIFEFPPSETEPPPISSLDAPEPELTEPELTEPELTEPVADAPQNVAEQPETPDTELPVVETETNKRDDGPLHTVFDDMVDIESLNTPADPSPKVPQAAPLPPAPLPPRLIPPQVSPPPAAIPAVSKPSIKSPVADTAANSGVSSISKEVIAAAEQIDKKVPPWMLFGVVFGVVFLLILVVLFVIA